MPGQVIDIDATLENADWLKGAWDLQIDNADDLRRWLAAHGMTAEHFKTLPVYCRNVDKQPWLREL